MSRKRETASGHLWSTPGVPHKGWRCADVEDLGCQIGTCEMCGKVDIRYIHYMEHPGYDRLSVGCVCAERMSGDYEGTRRRERDMRNAASRRKREAARRERERNEWPSTGWKVSDKGNAWRNHRGTFLLVFARRGGYGIKIGDSFDARTFASRNEAMLATLDAVTENAAPA